MGPFVSRRWVQVFAWFVTGIIVSLNVALVVEEIGGWIDSAGKWGLMIGSVVVPAALFLGGLLLWLVFRREKATPAAPEVSADEVAAAAAGLQKRYKRIGVALDARPSDSFMLAEAVALARLHGAELVLMHVVDGAGGQWYGAQTGVLESRDDAAYLHGLAERLRKEVAGQGIPAIDTVLGYGDPSHEIVAITRDKGIDLMVMGGHGHRGLLDWLYGQTISGVRHGLHVPVLTVRE
jgi:manganese transport protein